jgi:hypothetical protein
VLAVNQLAGELGAIAGRRRQEAVLRLLVVADRDLIPNAVMLDAGDLPNSAGRLRADALAHGNLLLLLLPSTLSSCHAWVLL